MSNGNIVKPYSITFEARTNYLYAYVQGEKYGYEIMMQYLMEILAECNNREFTQVLIVQDISETTSLVNMFRATSELPKMGFFRIRVAFVDRFSDHKDLNNFGKLVAQNRGMMGAKIFDSEAEADKWLSKAWTDPD